MRRTVVADACSLLNLTATGMEVEILESVGLELVVHRRTRGEAGYHLVRDPASGRRKIPVNLSPLLTSRRLHLVEESETQLSHFVECCIHLADPDALVLALCLQRKLDVFTDDKKVKIVAGRSFKSVGVLTTLQVLRDASIALGWSPDATREVLNRVHTRANFIPPRAADPLCDWYRTYAQ